MDSHGLSFVIDVWKLSGVLPSGIFASARMFAILVSYPDGYWALILVKPSTGFCSVSSRFCSRSWMIASVTFSL